MFERIGYVNKFQLSFDRFVAYPIYNNELTDNEDDSENEEQVFKYREDENKDIKFEIRTTILKKINFNNPIEKEIKNIKRELKKPYITTNMLDLFYNYKSYDKEKISLCEKNNIIKPYNYKVDNNYISCIFNVYKQYNKFNPSCNKIMKSLDNTKILKYRKSQILIKFLFTKYKIKNKKKILDYIIDFDNCFQNIFFNNEKCIINYYNIKKYLQTDFNKIYDLLHLLTFNI